MQQTVTLHCQAEGYPEPKFTWSPCSSDCNTGTLTIPEIFNDTVYTCTATNSEGSDSADASVGKQQGLILEQESVPYDFGKSNPQILFCVICK